MLIKGLQLNEPQWMGASGMYWISFTFLLRYFQSQGLSMCFSTNALVMQMWWLNNFQLQFLSICFSIKEMSMFGFKLKPRQSHGLSIFSIVVEWVIEQVQVVSQSLITFCVYNWNFVKYKYFLKKTVSNFVLVLHDNCEGGKEKRFWFHILKGWLVIVNFYALDVCLLDIVW